MFVQGKGNGYEGRVRRLLAPVLLLGSVLGITVRQEKKRIILAFIQRLIASALIIIAFIHEIPSIRYWMKHSEVSSNKRINFVIDILQNDCNHLSPRNEIKVFRLHLVHVLFNALLIVIYNILGHDFVWPNDNYTFFTSTLYAVMDFVIIFPFFEFLHFVNIIREFYKEMNTTLKRFEKSAATLDHNSDKPNTELRNEIIKLREIHFLLSKICTELNSCFSTQLLFIISVSMIQLVYAMRSVMGNHSLTDVEQSLLNLACDCSWFTPFFLFIIQLVAFSDRTSTEGKNSVVLAHHLMNVYYNDDDVLKELEFFVLQIRHHAGVFSIIFFDLDYPFLCTVISSLTTYFIVIVTFQGELDGGKPVDWNFRPPSSTPAEPIPTQST